MYRFYRTDLWFKIISQTLVVIAILFSLFHKTHGHLEKDLRLLSKFLPGIYSNKDQYLEDVKNKIASDQRHLSVRFIFRPVNISFLPNSFSVYVEHYLNHDSGPFKQGLYNFRADHSGMVIDMRIYNFIEDSLKNNLKQDLSNIQHLKLSDLNSSTNCDMLWRKLGGRKFIGTTRKQCLATVDGTRVRISTSATLTSTSLQWHEGWYRLQDGREVIRTAGPYQMKKIQKIKGSRNRYNKGKGNNMVVERLPVRNTKANLRSRNVERQEIVPFVSTSTKAPTRELRHFMNDAVVIPRKRKSWKLHDFKGVLAALLEGRRVHYAANIRKCDIMGNSQIEETAFGDFIDVFEIHRSNGDNGQINIKFSNSHKVQKGTEFVEMLRDVTLYADGTVVIDLYTLDSDQKHITSQSMAICWLFKPKTKRGDVRFTLDPRPPVRLVKSYRSLKHNIQKGKRIRMLADLSRCVGSDSRQMVIGGELSGYDITGSGHSNIGMTFDRMIIDTQSENIVSFRHYSVHFNTDGAAVITITDQGVTKNLFNQYGGQRTTHRCTVSRTGTNFGLILTQS